MSFKMLLTLWSFLLSQGQRNELHCREGLEGPVWHCDCSGWQTWFLQWQEKVSGSASVVLCCASFLPLGGSLTTVNSRTLYTDCACTVGLSLYYKRVRFAFVCFFPQTFQASDRQRRSAVGQDSPVRKGEDLQTGVVPANYHHMPVYRFLQE